MAQKILSGKAVIISKCASLASEMILLTPDKNHFQVEFKGIMEYLLEILICILQLNIFFIGGSNVHRSQPRYNFEEFNSWREADGFLCRNSTDCKWLDESLNCEGYELDFSPNVSHCGGKWQIVKDKNVSTNEH